MSFINRQYDYFGNSMIDYNSQGYEGATYQGGNCGCSNCLKGGKMNTLEQLPQNQYLGSRNLQLGNRSGYDMNIMASNGSPQLNDDFMVPSMAGYHRNMGYTDPYESGRLARVKAQDIMSQTPPLYDRFHMINNIPMNGSMLVNKNMEGGNIFDDFIHGVSTIGADIIGAIPIPGTGIIKNIWQHLPDIAKTLSPGYHYPYDNNPSVPTPSKPVVGHYTPAQIAKINKYAPKGRGKRGSHLEYPKKGSQEAKQKMAYLRSLRKN